MQESQNFDVNARQPNSPLEGTRDIIEFGAFIRMITSCDVLALSFLPALAYSVWRHLYSKLCCEREERGAGFKEN